MLAVLLGVLKSKTIRKHNRVRHHGRFLFVLILKIAKKDLQI